jgi:hypothetical protein
MLETVLRRAANSPEVSLIGVTLVVLTLAGLFASKPLTQSVVRALGSAGLLGLGAVLWIAVNGPLEGRTLVYVSPGHGLTLGDLLSAPPMVLGIGLLVGAVWRRKPTDARRRNRA